MFITRRLEDTDDHVGFDDPIHSQKLKSFSSIFSRSIKAAGKEVIVKADRALFACLVVIAQKRSIDVRSLFNYSLGLIPWSLANTDGTPSKTDKSKLLHLVEGNTAPAESVPSHSVW